MRENFSKTTRQKLAGRVNYKCCFPGCTNITIGPSGLTDDEVVILGEAAHIYAASPNGPRANPALSPEQLSAIQNGIWMCRQHARLIDADHYTYSADTLLLWKNNAEDRAHKEVKNIDATAHLATTLISFGKDIIVEALWLAATENNYWTFEICRWLSGTPEQLRSFATTFIPGSYICVETEGDGRMITGLISWYFDSAAGIYTISVPVADALLRTNVKELGADIKLTENTDPDIAHGDFKFVKDIGNARQQLEHITDFNDPAENLVYPGFLKNIFAVGSIAPFYDQYHHDPVILSRLVRLFYARLISIPTTARPPQSSPALHFISRIVGAEVISTQPIDHKIPVRIKVLWHNGNYWQDIINVPISSVS